MKTNQSQTNQRGSARNVLLQPRALDTLRRLKERLDAERGVNVSYAQIVAEAIHEYGRKNEVQDAG